MEYEVRLSNMGGEFDGVLVGAQKTPTSEHLLLTFVITGIGALFADKAEIGDRYTVAASTVEKMVRLGG